MRGSAATAILIGALVAADTALVRPRAALACSTCSCGDPTLTGMGAEKPYQGRLRAAAELRYRTDEIGEDGVDLVRLREERLELGLAWAPHERLMAAVTLPLLWRQIVEVNAAESSIVALGDVELRARGFVFQDRGFSPHHLVAITAGLRLPTALQPGMSSSSVPLPDEARAGSGALSALAGASYAWFAAPWSIYASASASLPVVATRARHPASSISTTAAVQYQLHPRLAGRAGLDTRLDGTGEEMGTALRHSGGFISFATAELLYSPVTDILVGAGARVPIWNALEGAHRESAIFSLLFAYDIR